MTAPTFTGLRVFDDYDVAELVPYIDWTPFFRTWGIRSRFPEVLTDPEFAEAARPLYDDALAMLDKIVGDHWFRPKAVVGIWPANAGTGDDVDDIVVYTDDSRTEVRARLHGLRQQATRTGDRPNYSISDFVAPVDSGVADYVGGFVVTAGPEEIAIAEEFERDNDDYSSILLKALADRLAEAFAERMHERVRTELWGYAPDEHFTPSDLLSESFRGVRPAPGYPAQPDHTEKVDAVRAARRAEHRSTSCSPSRSPCGPARRCRGCSWPTPSRGTSASARSGATNSSRTPPARAGRSRRPRHHLAPGARRHRLTRSVATVHPSTVRSSRPRFTALADGVTVGIGRVDPTRSRPSGVTNGVDGWGRATRSDTSAAGIVADDVTMTFDDEDVVDRSTSRSNPARSSA